MTVKMYAERDIMDDQLSELYCTHVQAMTKESLQSKSDIAAELAWRDLKLNDLASLVEELERERNELAAKVERLQAIPYTKTRAEFMESWGVDGMSADKKRLVNAAWDRAEWFFNQQAVAIKEQWQADTLENISVAIASHDWFHAQKTPVQIATALLEESNRIRQRAQEAGE